jgi:hypothetical protein
MDVQWPLPQQMLCKKTSKAAGGTLCFAHCARAAAPPRVTEEEEITPQRPALSHLPPHQIADGKLVDATASVHAGLGAGLVVKTVGVGAPWCIFIAPPPAGRGRSLSPCWLKSQGLDALFKSLLWQSHLCSCRPTTGPLCDPFFTSEPRLYMNDTLYKLATRNNDNGRWLGYNRAGTD